MLLAFSLLQGIRRARYSLAVVVDQTFTSGGVEFRAHFFIDDRHIIFLRVLDFGGCS